MTQLVKKNPKHLDIILGLDHNQSGAVASIIEAAAGWNYAVMGPTNGKDCVSMSCQPPLNSDVHPTIFIRKKMDERTISVVSREEIPVTVRCIIAAAFPGITALPS